MPAAFAAALERLGPFGSAPRLAVGVSGGADSSALALLADRWARARGGAILALVVDHRLREESALESMETVARLSRCGIAARRLVLDPPPHGPDVSVAAREARFATLAAACRQEGIVFLLLGHTRADQAETVLWRGLRGSGAAGLAGMAARRELSWGAVLRPLLGFAPASLRATCRAAGLAWVEDPTNRDLRHARPRLRAWLADPAGDGPAIAALARAAASHGLARAAVEASLAEELAAAAEIRPEGFALVTAPSVLSAGAAQSLVRTVGGLSHPPPAGAALALIRRGRGTLAGVEATDAGRFGAGIVLAREPAAVAPPLQLGRLGALWDRRWGLAGAGQDGITAGALADARVPGRDRLPARLARVLPAFRGPDNRLLAVPALGFFSDRRAERLCATFVPPEPLSCTPFVPCPPPEPLQGSAG